MSIREKVTLPAGPTLNPAYNWLLVKWGKNGVPASPECEDCGCDLTGEEVFETGSGWFCGPCKEKDDNEVHPNVDWREDFHADG